MKTNMLSINIEKPIPRMKTRLEDTEKQVPRVETKSEERSRDQEIRRKQDKRRGIAESRKLVKEKNQHEHEGW